MSSSQPFLASSPLSAASASHRRRKSRFTYKHLSLLAGSSTSGPLRVITLIDLDAFYAQCEMVRLDVPEDKPLAVQQWTGLIAVNYPARKFGITRFLNLEEAKKKCPDMILQHVATWKQGEDHWRYHPDAFQNVDTHKVSLDFYREQSRAILQCIKSNLPTSIPQRVEKASIDEVFIDLSAQVHQILLQRYPELDGPAPYDDPTENLPCPPTTALDWAADSLIDLDDNQTEDDDPDWDDICMLIASEIVRDLRAKIRSELKYTCSAGISRNKLVAKLGAGHKKPNNQTIVRNRAVGQFLKTMDFTDIRGLGGKLGKEVVEACGTEKVEQLLEIPLEVLKSKLRDEAGSWVYNAIRGNDTSEVVSRTDIQSMLSAKSFTKPINAAEPLHMWLRTFCFDIYTRLVQQGLLENKRRPRTITLHLIIEGAHRSKQLPIPTSAKITPELLFDLSKQLLNQYMVETRMWPCKKVHLQVGGFQEGVLKNMDIGSFLVKGDDAKNMKMPTPNPNQNANANANGAPTLKRKREGIDRFFRKDESRDEDEEIDLPAAEPAGDFDVRDYADTAEAGQDMDELWKCSHSGCSTTFSIHDDLSQTEHADWHVAMDMQEQFNKEERSQSRPQPPPPLPKTKTALGVGHRASKSAGLSNSKDKNKGGQKTLKW